MKRGIQAFWKDETAMGTIEMVALIIVLVGLAILFRDGIKKTFDSIIGILDAKITTVDKKY